MEKNDGNLPAGRGLPSWTHVRTNTCVGATGSSGTSVTGGIASIALYFVGRVWVGRTACTSIGYLTVYKKKKIKPIV